MPTKVALPYVKSLYLVVMTLETSLFFGSHLIDYGIGIHGEDTLTQEGDIGIGELDFGYLSTQILLKDLLVVLAIPVFEAFAPVQLVVGDKVSGIEHVAGVYCLVQA